MNRGFAYRERIRDAAPVLAHLAGRHRHSTEAQWRARLERGEVERNGLPVAPGALLAPGDELVWHRPPWDEPEADTRWRLLFEDDLLVAVAKPGGLPTLPGGGFLEHTLLAQVRLRYPEASPMHRLGRATSGIVLFARSHAAGARVQSAWREHRVVKGYRALAEGLAREDDMVITAPIGPVPHPWLGTLFAASAHGKPALSRARVLERRPSSTLFEVLIETGRPHQIRIHLAWAGHPLVGDPLYAPGGLPRPDLPALPGDGGYLLHAERLEFPHPASGEMVRLWAAPPQGLLMAGEGR